MHPSVQYEITKARIAQLHGEAERDQTARAACRTRRAQRQHDRGRPGAGGVAHRLFPVLRAWYTARRPAY